MSSREAILTALSDVPGPGLPDPVVASSVGIFESALAGLGAELVTVDSLRELTGRTVFADPDVPVKFLTGLNPVDSVWDAEIGITLAELGVAETGSLVLTTGPDRHRLASLAPPLHVALLSRVNIVPNLDAAFARLGPRTSVLISGPSRTADIEGVLVRGIHGPGRLWVVLTD